VTIEAHTALVTDAFGTKVSLIPRDRRARRRLKSDGAPTMSPLLRPILPRPPIQISRVGRLPSTAMLNPCGSRVRPVRVTVAPARASFVVQVSKCATCSDHGLKVVTPTI
jgi:hypothetical protein